MRTIPSVHVSNFRATYISIPLWSCPTRLHFVGGCPTRLCPVAECPTFPYTSLPRRPTEYTRCSLSYLYLHPVALHHRTPDPTASYIRPYCMDYVSTMDMQSLHCGRSSHYPVVVCPTVFLPSLLCPYRSLHCALLWVSVCLCPTPRSTYAS